jgi:hypothetical protein
MPQSDRVLSTLLLRGWRLEGNVRCTDSPTQGASALSLR